MSLHDARTYPEYLAMPALDVAWLGGLRWSDSGETMLFDDRSRRG